MAKQEISVYEKIEKHLFQDEKDAENFLTPREMEIKKRLMLCVSQKLKTPLMPDANLVTFLLNGCGGECDTISKSQAYNDISGLNKIIGSVQLPAKSWIRFMIIEGAKEGFEIAKTDRDAKGMAACLDKIGKYTRADKEDDDMDYSQMIPPGFEPTDDVTVLDGLEKIDNLEYERQIFRSMFKGNMYKIAEEAVIEK